MAQSISESNPTHNGPIFHLGKNLDDLINSLEHFDNMAVEHIPNYEHSHLQGYIYDKIDLIESNKQITRTNLQENRAINIALFDTVLRVIEYAITDDVRTYLRKNENDQYHELDVRIIQGALEDVKTCFKEVGMTFSSMRDSDNYTADTYRVQTIRDGNISYLDVQI